jgi:hypothetical protein
MANEKNLKPIKKGELSSEEAKRRGSLGGIKSGEVKREKKALKDVLIMIANLPVKDKKAIAQMKELGINPDDIDNQTAMAIGLFQRALKDTKSLEVYRDTMGEKPVDNINVTGNIKSNPYDNLSEEELRKLASGKK